MTAASWLIAPVAIPAMTAAFLVLALRHSLMAQRVVSVAATAAQLAVAIFLYGAAEGGPYAYLLGNWPAPFGIVLVLDRLSALMMLLTGVVAFGVLVASVGRWDQRGRHFHALFQFQLLGLNGAFLTGDLFNLFVFFEVLLIASYGLMLHGGGGARLKAGFHYVVINLIGSTVFLFAVGIIYAVTGTLNMADLALKVPQVAAADEALLSAGALLLFTVFAIKAAMVPLHWWLPPTYGSTSPPAAALFALMTKVGGYSIIRVSTLIFDAEAGAFADLVSPWLVPAGVITLILGTVGVLAARSLRDLISYSLVASMGTFLIAIGLDSASGLAAGLYYAVQSTLTSAALFLLAGVVVPETRDGKPGPMSGARSLLAALYFLLAIASVGMPPLAGFFGKLLILDAARASDFNTAVVWGAILATSFVMIVGFARMGMETFWSRADADTVSHGSETGSALPLMVIGGMIAALAALSVASGKVMDDMTATAQQVLAPQNVIEAVLPPSPTPNGAGD